MVLRDYLRREFNISSRLLRKLKANDLIALNGETVHTDARLIAGDLLTVDVESLARVSISVPPEDIPLDVIY